MKLHYLQHVPFENPGTILLWAEQNGHTVTKTLLYAGEQLPDVADFDWLVVMGGPMNIYEHDSYPWLVTEKELIGGAIAANKVVLGLCLGAQLIADVIGGAVTRNNCQEIGWLPVRFRESARTHPLFSVFPSEAVVFQWHGDTFSVLPEKAEVLAESAACAHQAFSYGSRVFGFQFHLENTLPIIEGLVENCRDEMVPAPYVQTPEELLAHPEHIARCNLWMECFLNRLRQLETEGQI